MKSLSEHLQNKGVEIKHDHIRAPQAIKFEIAHIFLCQLADRPLLPNAACGGNFDRTDYIEQDQGDNYHRGNRGVDEAKHSGIAALSSHGEHGHCQGD